MPLSASDVAELADAAADAAEGACGGALRCCSLRGGGGGARGKGKGTGAVTPEVAALIGSVGGDVGVCHHAKYNPIVYSGRVASLILEYTCHPPAGKPALQFNTIYVWEKRGKDWKIITEMYVSGSLH